MSARAGLGAAAIVLAAWSGPTLAQSPEEKLTAAVDRLTAAVEKLAASRAADDAMRRVEVAVSILGLRYRKIERMESEISSLDRQEENDREMVDQMRFQIDAFGKGEPVEGGPSPDQMKLFVAEAETRMAQTEERIQRSRERKSMLQADVERERRGVAALEETVEAWLDTLR